MNKGRRFAIVMAVLLALLFGAAVLGLGVGSTEVGLRDAVRMLTGRLGDETTGKIVMLRLSRVVLAALVGASLACAGVALQALLRNPLADPYILGISGGGAVGAAVFIAAGGGAGWLGVAAAKAGFSGVAISALAGSVAASGVVLVAGRRRGHIMPTTLLLVGVMVNAVCGAAVLALTFLSSREGLHEIVLWMMGDVGRPTPGKTLAGVAAAVLVSAALMWMLAARLNVMSMGDEDAAHMGVNVSRTRLAAFGLSAAVTGLSVAVAGPVGFVGLVVPHIARMFVGADHRLLFPAAVVLGAAFLVLADTAARVVRPGDPMPVGVVTAALGGPFFIWLLRRRRGRYFE